MSIVGTSLSLARRPDPETETETETREGERERKIEKGVSIFAQAACFKQWPPARLGSVFWFTTPIRPVGEESARLDEYMASLSSPLYQPFKYFLVPLLLSMSSAIVFSCSVALHSSSFLDPLSFF